MRNNNPLPLASSPILCKNRCSKCGNLLDKKSQYYYVYKRGYFSNVEELIKKIMNDADIRTDYYMYDEPRFARRFKFLKHTLDRKSFRVSNFNKRISTDKGVNKAFNIDDYLSCSSCHSKYYKYSTSSNNLRDEIKNRKGKYEIKL